MRGCDRSRAQIRDTIAVDDLHVDHRKIIVIDGRIAYCGGANIGAQYLFHDPFDPRKDARVEGEERKKRGLPGALVEVARQPDAVRGADRARDRHAFPRPVDPRRRRGLPPSRAARRRAPREGRIAKAEVLLNEPNDQPNDVRERYVELIRGARESIFIENPYLYHPSIVDALIAAKTARPVAARRPGAARAHLERQLASRTTRSSTMYSRYLAAGIAVHEYQNHFNHLKIAVFDDRFSIHGSTNLNYRSLENDKDFELVVLRRRRRAGARSPVAKCATSTSAARSGSPGATFAACAAGSGCGPAIPARCSCSPAGCSSRRWISIVT